MGSRSSEEVLMDCKTPEEEIPEADEGSEEELSELEEDGDDAGSSTD